MPYYDYLCPAGHQRESLEHRDTDVLDCDCGQPARRIVTAAHVAGAAGFARRPTREHYVNVNRAVEAQGEITRQAERAGIEMPDLWRYAKDRVARGDAVAIE